MGIILFIHVLLCVALIGLVLLQQGKGASMGAAFGSGASGTVFGSRGPAGFLMKLTAFLVAAFFVTSLLLGYMAASNARQSNLMHSTMSAPINPHSNTDAALPHHTGQ